MNDAEYTHVLAWMPPFLLPRGFTGYWDLQARADWDNGTPRDAYDTLDAPADASADELAQWVSAQLGSPVTLTRSETGFRLRLHRWHGRWHTVPVYFVRQAPA